MLNRGFLFLVGNSLDKYLLKEVMWIINGSVIFSLGFNGSVYRCAIKEFLISEKIGFYVNTEHELGFVLPNFTFII